MNDINSASSRNGTLRTVAVVTRNPQPEVLDRLLDAGGYDIVFVESLDRAYSSIKRAAPELVILCFEIEDIESVQLLSMLRLDSDTASIPVCTYLVSSARADADGSAIDVDRDAPARGAVVWMN